MFKSARIQLTLWYVLIIGVITIIFSVIAYRLLTLELERGLRIQTLRIIEPGRGMRWYEEESPSFFVGKIIPENDVAPVYEDAAQRIFYRIFIADAAIIIISAGLAYWLAGRTLQPIEVMVENQKRFVSDASHELKTPLTSLRTEIEVALREKRLTDKDAKAILQSSLDDVIKMQKLIEYLLSLSRYQYIGKSIPFESVSVSKIIDSAVKKIQYKLDEKKIVLETDIKEKKILGNDTSLEEVIVILLDNAIKYSKKSSKIEVFGYFDRRSYTVEVHDFGMGIPLGDIPYIFDRFYRSDKSRNKEIEGYGLGLSIAKQIVDLHSGKIEVESTFGEGSTFRVVLPIH